MIYYFEIFAEKSVLLNMDTKTTQNELPTYQLSCHLLPRDCRPDEILFIKKVSPKLLVIFYRGNYGDVFDITTGLTNNSEPIFSLSGYSTHRFVSGNPVDVFLYYDEQSKKELLVCYTDSPFNQSILIYDLTGEKQNAYSKGYYSYLYVGCPFTLEMHCDRIFLRKRENNKLYLIDEICWDISKKQYETPRKQLFKVFYVKEDNIICKEKDYILCSIDCDPRPERELENLVKLDITSFNEKEIENLLSSYHDPVTWKVIKKDLNQTWSFYYSKNEKILYTGQCCWLCEWKLK